MAMPEPAFLVAPPPPAPPRFSLVPKPEVGEQLSLFDEGIDLRALRLDRAALAERHWSEHTKSAYSYDWRVFTRWCAEAGRRTLPASSDTLQLFAVAEARAGRLPSTIARHIAAIRAKHLAAGFASPVDQDFREVLGGINRKLGTAPRHAKAALSVADLKLLLAVCADGPRGARDRAMLLVGFASGLRRSNLVALDLADVEIRPEGLAINVPRSKTDQEGKGWQVGVNRGEHRATCPTRALAAWIAERGAWDGPLFCRIGRDESVKRERLFGRDVARLVKRAAKDAGLDPRKYGGHSLRAGCATTAAENGSSDIAIMGRTGHKSVAMLGRYVRHGSLFALDPLAGAL
jgi:integrase